MPTNFLDLPREIRDEIYSLILISPNNLIQPRLTSRSPPHIELYIPLPPLETGKRPLKHDPQFKLSISIIRTCRQIYNEARGMFWASNKFFFPDYTFHERGLVYILKAMGQIASRLITHVCILMRPRNTILRGGGPPYNGLAKALQLLASRARHGSLREVELVFDKWAVNCGRDSASGPMALEGLLNILRNASQTFQRTIRLPLLESAAIVDVPFPRDLHHAFGGRLFVGDVLIWENYKEVSKLNNVFNIKETNTD